MRLVQDGKTVQAAQSRANFHLEELDDNLCLYLPKNEDDREVCFERQLPRRLCQYLKITDAAAESVIGGVFRRDNLNVIKRILDDAGVSQLDNDFASLDGQFAENEPEIKDLIALTRNTRLSTPSEESRDLVRVHSLEAPASVQTSTRAQETSHRATRASTPANNSTTGDHTAPLQSSTGQHLNSATDAAYKKILENLVDIARHRVGSNIFESGSPRAQGPPMVDPLSHNLVRGTFAGRSQERDFRLGAAGELYVC